MASAPQKVLAKGALLHNLIVVPLSLRELSLSENPSVSAGSLPVLLCVLVPEMATY